MGLLELLARALAVTVLAGTLLLPLADHHAAGHPDVGRQVAHHHTSVPAAPDERAVPLLLPGGPVGAVWAAPGPLAIVGIPEPPPLSEARPHRAVDPVTPASLLEPPLAPPPQLSA